MHLATAKVRYEVEARNRTLLDISVVGDERQGRVCILDDRTSARRGTISCEAATALRAASRSEFMETASISAISSDLSVSVSFVIANELVEAAREDGMRNDELAAVLVAVVVLITAAKSMVGRWQASSLENGTYRVKALAKQRAASLGVVDVDVFVKRAMEEVGSRKGLLAFVSELLSIATRISLSVTIQVLAVSVSATGSSRLLRVGTLLSVVFFFLFFENAFVKRR